MDGDSIKFLVIFFYILFFIVRLIKKKKKQNASPYSKPEKDQKTINLDNIFQQIKGTEDEDEDFVYDETEQPKNEYVSESSTESVLSEESADNNYDIDYYDAEELNGFETLTQKKLKNYYTRAIVLKEIFDKPMSIRNGGF